MCGIIGVTGSTNAARLLLDALTILEYRGYDSAGLAFVDEVGAPLLRYRAAERAKSIGRLEIDGRRRAPPVGLPRDPRGRRRFVGHDVFLEGPLGDSPRSRCHFSQIGRREHGGK